MKISVLLLAIFPASSTFSMEKAKKETEGGAFFSTYNPSKEFIDNYGQDAHRRFQEIAPKAVDNIYGFLQKASDNPDAAKVCDFVDFIGKQRTWVAQQANSKNKPLFGKSRRLTDGYRGMGDLTPLYPSAYKHWRSQIVTWMNPILDEMSESNTYTKQEEFKYSRLNVSIDPASTYDLLEIEKSAYEKSATPDQAMKLANHDIVFGSTFYSMDIEQVGTETAKARALEMYNRFDDICVVKAQFSLKMGTDFVPTSAVFMRYLKDNNSRVFT